MLLACVSGAGGALTPMIVSEPPSHDFLWVTGLRQKENVII
jgi:hypothetical protein